ncbi:MAG: hypothetical protein ACRDRA_09645 [Pseudonocardiaceae bacterium]
MDTDSYVAFLSFAVLLVLIDGLILYRSGLRYLGSAYDAGNARSVMQLVIVLFHLVVLGVLALISMIDVATGLPARDLVVKLGVVLLTLGVAHGVTMAILKAVRDRRRDEQILEDEMSVDRANVHPATDQR